MTTSIISEEKLIRRPFEWNSIVLSGLEELGSELWPAKKSSMVTTNVEVLENESTLLLIGRRVILLAEIYLRRLSRTELISYSSERLP